MNLHTFIFIGRSGAGKGTQSLLLQKFLNKKYSNTPLVYIETGEYFRKYIKNSGYTWDLAREIYDTGGRQPDFLAVWIWSQVFIEKLKKDQHLIFDGTPRSLGEAQMLNTALPFYGRTNPVVVFLDVSQEWSENRLRERGRADDLDSKTIARRLSWYEKDVLPAINFYKDNPSYRFLHINAEQTPEEIHKEILRGSGLTK